jgi:hypothetical protein
MPGRCWCMIGWTTYPYPRDRPPRNELADYMAAGGTRGHPHRGLGPNERDRQPLVLARPRAGRLALGAAVQQHLRLRRARQRRASRPNSRFVGCRRERTSPAGILLKVSRPGPARRWRVQLSLGTCHEPCNEISTFNPRQPDVLSEKPCKSRVTCKRSVGLGDITRFRRISWCGSA